MSKLRSYLKSMGKYLFVVACGVLLYMLCEHFTAVRKVIKTLLSVLTPVMPPPIIMTSKSIRFRNNCKYNEII